MLQNGAASVPFLFLLLLWWLQHYLNGCIEHCLYILLCFWTALNVYRSSNQFLEFLSLGCSYWNRSGMINEELLIISKIFKRTYKSTCTTDNKNARALEKDTEKWILVKKTFYSYQMSFFFFLISYCFYYCCIFDNFLIFAKSKCLISLPKWGFPTFHSKEGVFQLTGSTVALHLLVQICLVNKLFWGLSVGNSRYYY